MRRTIAIVGLWVAAGVGAVTLSSAAVSMVGHKVTASRPASLDANQIRNELAEATGSTTTRVTGDAATSTSTPTTAGSTPSAGAGSDGRGTSTTRPTTQSTQGPNTGGNESLSTTTVASPGPTVRTYSLTGGTATLRFSPNGVTVQDATPKPGFSVDVESEDDNGVRVVFRSEAHESRVDGWWEGGPRDRIREEARSGD